MSNNVNIYNPFWTFFFIFFLIYNIFLIVHHFSFNASQKSVVPFKPQQETIPLKYIRPVATKNSQLPDAGQVMIANSPDVIPKIVPGKPEIPTAYQRT